MGFWGGLWDAAKATGEHAVKKADAAVDAVRSSVEQHESQHEENREALMARYLAGGGQLTPEQQAAMRKYAFKPGKLTDVPDPTRPKP